LRIITALVHPVLPESTARIWSQLGLGSLKTFNLRDLRWGELAAGVKMGTVEAVFPRADKGTAERMRRMEQDSVVNRQSPASPGLPVVASGNVQVVNDQQLPASDTQLAAVIGAEAGQRAAEAAAVPPITTPAAAGPAPPATEKIGIEDFSRVELRVAQVKVAERVKGADKLLRLEVDLGDHTRQIVAGIAEAYAPELLIGRKIVIVANLQPRKLRGLVSDGMLLAASIEGGKPVLASFLEDAPIGARLK
jgi:methionyl-tRNA synthetase